MPSGLSLNELSAGRAQFIAGGGWGNVEEVQADIEARNRCLRSFGEFDQVILWFEHDLYDQLQLLQLLDFFAGEDLGGTALTLICAAEFLAARLRDGSPSASQAGRWSMRIRWKWAAGDGRRFVPRIQQPSRLSSMKTPQRCPFCVGTHEVSGAVPLPNKRPFPVRTADSGANCGGPFRYEGSLPSLSGKGRSRVRRRRFLRHLGAAIE